MEIGGKCLAPILEAVVDTNDRCVALRCVACVRGWWIMIWVFWGGGIHTTLPLSASR